MRCGVRRRPGAVAGRRGRRDLRAGRTPRGARAAGARDDCGHLRRAPRRRPPRRSHRRVRLAGDRRACRKSRSGLEAWGSRLRRRCSTLFNWQSAIRHSAIRIGRALMSGAPLSIWEQARLQGHSRRDFLQFCSWLAAAAGIEASAVCRRWSTRSRRSRGCRSSGSTSRSAPAAASRSSGPRTRSWRTSCSTRSRSTTPRRCRRRPATRPRRRLHDTMTKHKGEYLMLRRGIGADRGRRRLLLHRRAARRSTSCARRRPSAQGARGLGQLRLERLHPGGPAQPDRRDAHPQADLAASRIINVPGCPPIARGDGRHDRPPAGVRRASRSSTAWAARRRSTPGACTTPATAGPTTTPASSSRVFDDENAKQGLLPLQDGLPRARSTYNSCGVIRWNNGVSYPIQSGHGCIGCSRSELLGQRAVLPAPGVVPGLRHRDDGRHDRRGASAR